MGMRVIEKLLSFSVAKTPNHKCMLELGPCVTFNKVQKSHFGKT